MTSFMQFVSSEQFISIQISISWGITESVQLAPFVAVFRQWLDRDRAAEVFMGVLEVLYVFMN